MSKTIKSITFSAGQSFTAQEYVAAALIDFAKNNPDNVSIEYAEHEKQKTLKRPNGAEILAPEIGTRYYCNYYTDYTIGEAYWDNARADLYRLSTGWVFLEKEQAIISTELMKRHLEIVDKVYAINVENNWVADWSDSKQSKCCCYWSQKRNKLLFYEYIDAQGDSKVYCKQAQEYLKTLSVEDIKAFLLIYT